MCLKPVLIDNPYLGLQKIGLNFLHDCTSRKMAVPCGHCSQCVAMKQSYIVQRSQMESKGNDLWFCTLTYKSSMLKYIDVNGYRLRYAYLPDFQNLIKRLRRNNAFGMPFRFWAVVEYGGKKHRPHFHVIFSTPKIPGETKAQKAAREKLYHDIILKEWRRNVATTIDKHGRTVANTRAPKYLDLCDYKVSYKNGKRRSTYDFHWIDPGVTDSKGKIHDESDVAFYVTKYTTKANKYVDSLKSALRLNLEPDEFKAHWALLRPKALVSKKWGDPDSDYVRQHVRNGIERALAEPESLFPYFINPSTGQTFPLAPFFKKRFFTIQDALSFFYKSPEDYGTGDAFRIDEYHDPLEIRQLDMRFDRMKSGINAREMLDPCGDNTLTHETIYDDSDWLIDDYNSLAGLYDTSYIPIDEYGCIIGGSVESYRDPCSDFDPYDFDDLPAD